MREDLEDAQGVQTLAHELAPILLGHGTSECADPRSHGEVEAESVAFVVCGAA
ncbi:MAG: hypothetical protein ACXVXI_09705 [Mycobacteriaceae bacterium]